MSTFDVIRSRRTIRFYEQKPVPEQVLRDMIDGARCTSCASNSQKLRYVVVTSPDLVKAVFDETAWAGRVTPRRTPVWGVNAPAAFIAVTSPTPVGPMTQADAGAAIQSMQLIAWEAGLGCCWMGAIKRPQIQEILGIESTMDVMYVVAVGYPAEQPVSEDVDDVEKTGYYLDDNDCLHVPKLSAEAVARWM